ncbi:MAG: hypothetical protein PHX27_02840 [Candidatus ainarchaeum sp.]|nr:hypothetical protein [Candidatus ainarchaeum sp.]
MDFSWFVFGVIDFLKFLIPISIVLFILHKIIFPIKEKLSNKYDLSWVKACLLINFVIIFLIIFSSYLYFFFIGGLIAPTGEHIINYDLFENLLLIGLALLRIIIVTIILSIALLFFEFFASFIIELLDKKDYSLTIKLFLGIACSTTIFLVLLFFFFNWVPLGLFVYIFYGFVSDLPLLTIINVF